MLFYVLNLFAQLLEVALEVNHEHGEFFVVGFRAQRVDLAIHLLKQEVELAPMGLLGLEEIQVACANGGEAKATRNWPTTLRWSYLDTHE